MTYDKEISTIFTSDTIEKEMTTVEKEDSKKTWTLKRMKILIPIVFGNLLLGSCYSLLAPFFPAEAERKHASPTSYGLIFGIYQLSMCISSFFYAKLIPILKPGFMLKSGMLVSAVCAILFGLLDRAPPGAMFIGLAFVVRFIDALGAAAFFTASYTTVGMEMSDIVGRAMSIIETAFAFGMAGGPVLGGFLYSLGGYPLPFMVVGSLLFIGTAVNIFVFTNDDSDVLPQTVKAMDILTDIDFAIDVLVIASCFTVFGFNEASLEPHIRQFNLAPFIVGLIFFIQGIMDALFSPVWGYFAEKMSNAHYLTFLGILLLIAGFVIIGPISPMNFPTTLWVIILAQFLLGLGIASEIVCTFTHGLKHMIDKGFPNDVATYSIISSILFSSACFGGFLGPSLGGYLIDQIGYIKTTEVVVGMKVFVAITCGSRLIYLGLKRSKQK